MRTGRIIVIRTILALGAAGSILAGSAAIAAPVQASTAQAPSAISHTWYHE